MPQAPLPESVCDFLCLPNAAVIASLRTDGSPHTALTWYDWEDGRALISMYESRVRLSYLRADPRVSLSVFDLSDWYRSATVIGHAVDFADDVDLADIDRLATRYTGEPYRDRVRKRVSAWIEPESWYGWDATAAAPREATTS